ncbi:unnamed protein product [Symbiodinium microadriaticum]|nr:unnamed protein product [Symbiodinium microadriaticum]
MLRKKKYRTPAESASDAASTTGAPSTEAIAPPTGAEEELKVVSEGATGVTAPAHTTPASPSSVGFNTSPSPTAAVKLVDFSRKVYVAPLTTIGNLPYRRILKEFGADITCGEMAMAQNIQSGQSSEWALLRRHSSEDLFGVQLAGGHADYMGRTAKIIENETQTDFIDLNCGCPIDVICSKGAGSALMNRPKKLIDVVSSLTRTLKKTSVTVKIRTGWDHNNPTGHKLIPEIQKVSRGKISAIMMHGRSRLQRYTGPANWEYILRAARAQDTSLPTIPIIGNGDIFSYDDWKGHQQMLQDNMTGDEIGLCDCAMIGRGAIIKPWLPTEVKESRHWDISASERMDMYKRFVSYGMEHWGSDQQGINTTRRFLLEWLSFTHRYVPMGIIEHDRLPQRISQKPPLYRGRGDLETLLSSPHSDDWIEIARILLGPLPDGFRFTPKHKSNSYAAPVATQVVESAASEVSNDWN